MPKCFSPKNWLRFLSRSVIRHKIRWLAVAVFFFLCGPLSDQLMNGLYITHDIEYAARLNVWHTVSLWFFLLGPWVFFCYMAIVFRHWLLSEKWLMMILGLALYFILPVFGLQYPYCDSRFYGHPFMEYFSTLAGCYFLYGVFLIGPELIFLHFALRNKKRRIAFSRRLIAPAFVILLSTILFAVFIKTLPDC